MDVGGDGGVGYELRVAVPARGAPGTAGRARKAVRHVLAPQKFEGRRTLSNVRQPSYFYPPAADGGRFFSGRRFAEIVGELRPSGADVMPAEPVALRRAA
jgi:hypothetical protein